MRTQTNALLPLVTASLLLVLRAFFQFWRLWNHPLNHGPRFFFGVEVAPGFYEGPGMQWLKRYRILLVAQYLMLVAAFIVPVVLRRWNDLPVMAPVDVFTLFALIGGFGLMVRRKLGAHPPRLTRIAVPLEARRLSNYIWWPGEAMVVAFLAFSWLLLFTQGETDVRWQWPVLITYVVMGMLPGKIIVARNSYPLPPERTEEHYRWLEANRRYSLRVMESMRWFCIAILAGYAVRHVWPWLRWPFLGAAMAVFVVMTGILIRGSGQLAAMGRDLRPVGSWAGPFDPARLMLRGGLLWSVLYCCGLAALLVFFRR